MDRATIALVVSTASAAFTGGGLVWQLLLYRLSGARVGVRLIPAILDANGTLARGPDRGWPAKVQPTSILSLGPWFVDLAEVRVTNLGRTAISVSDIGLDFGRLHWWSIGRYTIRGVPVAVHDGCLDEVVRLETGESVSVFLDLWQLVKSHHSGRAGKSRVRASVYPAGRRKKRSKWRKRWVFHGSRKTLMPTQQISPELRAYQAFWRAVRQSPDMAAAASSSWFPVLQFLKRGEPDASGLVDVLPYSLNERKNYIAYSVIEAFEGREVPRVS